jgi:hypothetical protein
MISGAYLPFVLLVLPTPLLEFASVKDNGGAVVSSSSWGLAFGALGLRHGDGEFAWIKSLQWEENFAKLGSKFELKP